ncbi:beta-lactamase family protein [Actinoallomurus purpureus]|uniref:serine hydrolase domain-containing protein n=1 Tax=Actinoallomurus purpureus TaxID=478114 RepID=UPI00209328E5|nr:serine hydrolase domain-containing protein [Actinoallomurus purpureus]MCO6010166.1 beta-lactamase family protein [Actinoallomurus purpureus]
MRILKHAAAVAAGSALVCLALPITPTAAAADVASSVPPPSRSTLVQQAGRVVSAGVPGVNIETRDERGTQSVVAGVGNLRTHEPPRPSGQFRIGSVTKSFTATLVLSLVADGRIQLDAPIDRYLPGVLPYSEPITVRQLLQHRSGLFDYGSVLWANPKLVAQSRYRDYAPADLVRIATQKPLQFTPGSQFLYSNTDYIMLGMLVEKVTGDNYAHELSRRVLDPAGLRHTYLAGHDPRLRQPSARGYEAVHSPTRLTDLTTYNMSVAWASGDIVSTTHDLNLFYSALLDGRLVPPTLLRQMQQSEPAFPGFEYGLGLGHTEMCGQQVWGHVGGVPGYGTYSFTSPQSARQITISVNRSLTLNPAAGDEINALIADEFCGDPAQR